MTSNTLPSNLLHHRFSVSIYQIESPYRWMMNALPIIAHFQLHAQMLSLARRCKHAGDNISLYLLAFKILIMIAQSTSYSSYMRIIFGFESTLP